MKKQPEEMMSCTAAKEKPEDAETQENKDALTEDEMNSVSGGHPYEQMFPACIRTEHL